jgi:hypothetical protein
MIVHRSSGCGLLSGSAWSSLPLANSSSQDITGKPSDTSSYGGQRIRDNMTSALTSSSD